MDKEADPADIFADSLQQTYVPAPTAPISGAREKNDPKNPIYVDGGSCAAGLTVSSARDT
jgi:hypothetical protein